MAKAVAKVKRQNERGMALVLTLFALLLLSAIGLLMLLSSDTETRIDANYGSGLKAYYAAKSGLEEVRDRVRYSSTTSGGLADLLPQDIAGNAGGVLYILNPAGGETVDPTDPTGPYFDDQLCHDYNSGASPAVKCATVPSTSKWQLPPQNSLATASGQLGYKWIRVNIKTNRTVLPNYCVDQTCAPGALDTRICWDGQTEQLSPGGASPSCDANGMQTVYMLTSLAATPQANGPAGARKLLRAEVVAPAIRPPGALTLGASSTAPVLSSGSGMPTVTIDGRVHQLDGTLATGNSCSAISPLAADSARASAQLEQALNQVRLSIVQAANGSCQADGTGLNGKSCTPGLWWVRGTDDAPRFITAGSGPTIVDANSGSSGTFLLNGSSGQTDSSSDMTANSNRGGPIVNGGTSGGSMPEISPSGVASAGICDPANPACYTNLNLAAPQIFATSATSAQHVPTVTVSAGSPALFLGHSGNQPDAAVYQPAAPQIVQNEIAAVTNLIAASVNKPNYFSVTAGKLAASYGTSKNPAIVVFSDPTLTLENNTTLTGYGILVTTNKLEINNATLQWNGIVLVQSSSGRVKIGQGANGSINGALLLQPGASIDIENTLGQFRLTYSCEAVDLPFNALPIKTISTAETSF